MSERIPAIVLGGTGYVAGELLRLIAQHPNLELQAAVSDSRSGTPIRQTFAHLQGAFGNQHFISMEQAPDYLEPLTAVFSAAPHGASAALIAELLKQGAAQEKTLRVVDVSADFRFASNAAYKAVYGHDHGAPEILNQFCCAVPEHLAVTDLPHVGHPGCFATALLLAAVPLLDMQVAGPDLYAVGVTGSTGSGRSSTETTHHPVRHANMFAYKALSHRHGPEVAGICETLTGIKPQLHFIPHSGPFARGIHMTVQAQLREHISADELRARFQDFYADQPFVQIVDGPPKMKDVVGSNYAHVGIAVENGSVAVFTTVDNLVKGAAGGAVQWMNRLLNLDETAGLLAAGPGWI